MSDNGDSIGESGLDRIVAACDRYETEWRAGGAPLIEVFLDEVVGAERDDLLRELLVIDIQLRLERGEHPIREDYLDRFPDRAEVIEQAIRNDRTGWTTVRAVPGHGEATEEGRFSTDEAVEARRFPSGWADTSRRQSWALAALRRSTWRATRSSTARLPSRCRTWRSLPRADGWNRCSGRPGWQPGCDIRGSSGCSTSAHRATTPYSSCSNT